MTGMVLCFYFLTEQICSTRAIKEKKNEYEALQCHLSQILLVGSDPRLLESTENFSIDFSDFWISL